DEPDRARRKGSPAGVPCLRLAGADEGYPQQSRHDGRRRDRHQVDPCCRRGAGLCRLFGGRGLLKRLVDGADGRGPVALDRTASQRGVILMIGTSPVKESQREKYEGPQECAAQYMNTAMVSSTSGFLRSRRWNLIGKLHDCHARKSTEYAGTRCRDRR